MKPATKDIFLTSVSHIRGKADLVVLVFMTLEIVTELKVVLVLSAKSWD